MAITSHTSKDAGAHHRGRVYNPAPNSQVGLSAKVSSSDKESGMNRVNQSRIIRKTVTGARNHMTHSGRAAARKMHYSKGAIKAAKGY